MMGKRKNLVTVCLFAGVLVVGVILLQGCEDSDSGTSSSGKQETAEQKPEAMTTPMPVKKITVAVEQTMCPIMGMAIDKKVFIEYEGKKVYFCCPGCEDKFNEEPKKYIAKLPQFKQ